MAKMLWAVICNRIITDGPSNSISYIDCIETINAQDLPANLFQCSIGTMWRKTKDNDVLNVRLFVKAPGSSKEQQILETKEHVFKTSRHRLNFQLDGMPIEEEGYHIFIIRQLQENQWLEITQVGFDVVKAKKQD